MVDKVLVCRWIPGKTSIVFGATLVHTNAEGVFRCLPEQFDRMAGDPRAVIMGEISGQLEEITMPDGSVEYREIVSGPTPEPVSAPNPEPVATPAPGEYRKNKRR